MPQEFQLLKQKDYLQVLPHAEPLLWAAAGFLIFLSVAFYRHDSFRSTGYDLAVFDQGTWMLSNGEAPVSSFLKKNLLADHASIVLLPLSLLHDIAPGALWLLAVQSLCLSLCVIPLWQLCRMTGVPESAARGVAIAWLLNPVVFNVNLFDFHTDVIAIPLILSAMVFARTGKFAAFALSVVLALSTKEVMAFGIAGGGLYLLLDRRVPRIFGIFALVSGTAWFCFAALWLIPHLGDGALPSGFERYQFAGRSFESITGVLVEDPSRFFSYFRWKSSILYLAVLLVMAAWGLHPRRLLPLLGALPYILLNITSSASFQTNFRLHYSLPILPFLFLAIIEGLSTKRVLLKSFVPILLWSAGLFLLFGIRGLYIYGTAYPSYWYRSDDSKLAITEALRLVPASASVLTTNFLAPHISQRRQIDIISERTGGPEIEAAGCVFIENSPPWWPASERKISEVIAKIGSDDSMAKLFSKGDILLFCRTPEKHE